MRKDREVLARKGTFREVARIAGASVATVSRVATGSARVSPEIADRVKKAAQQLGVDLFRRSRSKVIAFILSNRDMLHSFHSHILAGTEAYCAARGWNTLFLTLRYQAGAPWKELHLPHILERRDTVSGFIIAGTNSRNFLDLLTHKGIPFAVLGNNVVGEWKPADYDVVWFDDIQGSYEITRYLLSLGHRDIWYVGNTRLPWYLRRYEGYARAMQEAGVTPRLSEIASDNDGDIGFLATKAILAQRRPVSAIFAGGDPTAEGVYKALRDGDLHIPQDISAAGFNDIEATILHPRLTTVRVFTEQVGKHLAEMVLNRIESPGQGPQQFTIPTQLVRRESCEPLPATKETHRGEGSRQTELTRTH
jgi:DNA-binding LacI/PurR family transcriptional regulator